MNLKTKNNYTYKVIADKIIDDRNLWEKFKRFFIKPKIPKVKGITENITIQLKHPDPSEKYYTIFREQDQK